MVEGFCSQQGTGNSAAEAENTKLSADKISGAYRTNRNNTSNGIFNKSRVQLKSSLLDYFYILVPTRDLSCLKFVCYQCVFCVLFVIG